MRSAKVVRMMYARGCVRGAQAQIARELGVARSTVSRDLIRARNPDGQPCRTCERPMSHRAWERLNRERATQQPGHDDIVGCAPSILEELRKRGLLDDEDDELLAENHLGCISD
jgi:IS30 family transposase